MIDPLKIHALADGELPPEEMVVLKEQISCCERSCAELHAINSLKDALGRTRPIECEATWKSCVKRLNEIDKTRRIEFTVGRYAWGLCSAFLAVIVIGGYFSRAGSTGMVRSGDVARMVSGLVPSTSFKGDSPQAARRWLSENVKNVPMKSDHIQLVNGIKGETPDHARQIIRLNLRDAAGNLALIIIDPVDHVDGLQPAEGQFQKGTIDQMRCVAWMDNGRALLLVGDRSCEELCSIASSIVLK